MLLAELAGIAPAQLYRYESGKTKPRPEAADKIAAALGVSTDWLARGELPIARDTKIDPPVPADGGMVLERIELPSELAIFIEQLAIQNGRTVEMELLDLVHQSLKATKLERLAAKPSASTPTIPAPSKKLPKGKI